VVTEIEIILRLALAGFLSGIIGLERESRHRAAGLRTHILVSVGSALIMLISIYGFPAVGRDPARLAAQVVSGIGFLGAGTIMREGVSIRGLTTAASLWVVAGIGLGVGAGFYLASVVTTVLVASTLLYLNQLERRVFPYRHESYLIEMLGRGVRLRSIEERLGEFDVKVKKSDLEYDTSKDRSVVYLSLLIPVSLTHTAVVETLAGVEGVVVAKGED
jgi:putative Mg2+ transporter-C (MgtC) family protein